MIDKITEKYLDNQQERLNFRKSYRLFLICIGIIFIAIHIFLILKTKIFGLFGLSILAWFAIVSLLWKKRHKLTLKTLTIPTLLGGALVIWVFWQSFTLTEPTFLYISPLIFGLAMTLLAFGFKGIKQYHQELIILFFLGVPKTLISTVINVYPLAIMLTAKMSMMMLWYTGWEASLVEGAVILVPDGGVTVVESCSGTDVMAYMLALAVIFVVKFPLSTKQNTISIIGAIALGFLANSIRVAILALLSAQNMELFDYWHEGEGGQLFTIMPVIVFGFVYVWVVKKRARLKKTKRKSG